MSAIVFLIAFVLLSLLGGLLLWLRDRGPRSMEAHMKAFERELEALSPETPIDPATRPRSGNAHARRPPPQRAQPQRAQPRSHAPQRAHPQPYPRQQSRARPRGPGPG